MENKEFDLDAYIDQQLGQQDKASPNINRASYKDPDHQAEVITLAESHNLDNETVENNINEIKRQDRVDSLIDSVDAINYPKLSQYLSDDNNSRVSIDDIDNLKGIESAAGKNIKRTWGDIGKDAGIDLFTGVIDFGQSAVGIADLLTVNMVGHGLEAIGYDPDAAKAIAFQHYSKSRIESERKIGEADGFIETLATLAGEPSAAIGRAIQSIPMMIGTIGAVKSVAAGLLTANGLTAGTAEATAFLSQPHIITKLAMAGGTSEGALGAGSIQEQARSEDVSYLKSAPYAIGSGAITAAITLGAGKLLPDVEASFAAGSLGKDSLIESGKKIAKGIFQEGVLEELPQSTSEQIFTNLATNRPALSGVPEAAASGLVTGSLMGGGLSTMGQSKSILNKAAKRTADRAVSEISEQQVIDEITEYAQASTTRGRKEDRYRSFLNGIEADKSILVSSEAVVDAVNSGVELPTYVTEQISGLGTDIEINLEQFGTDIAPNEELMTALRPHMKMSNETLSPAQIEAADDFSVKTLVERAEKSQAALTEAQKIYDEVKEQIVDTGRQGDATARYSAAVIPAYATVKAEQTGFTVSEVYELMGLGVEGPATELMRNKRTEKQNKKMIAKAAEEGYGGDSAIEADEWVKAKEKGLDTSPEAVSMRANDMGYTIGDDGQFIAPEGFEPRTVNSAFDPDYSKIKSTLAQKTDEGETTDRGGILISDDSMIIRLHEASDLSTFLHESAHLFLEMELKLSDMTGEITEDQQIILDWLEVDSFESIGTEQHEKFAETFEVYLREGKAPSLALRDAFAAFKRWLLRVYQNLTDSRLQRAELNDQVREVFDRMLATEAEIELATANPAFDQFFRSKEQSGMSDSQWEVYQKQQERKQNRAQETLDTKVMTELTKRYSKEWKDEKAVMIDEEIERLSSEPVYQILNAATDKPMDRDAVKELSPENKIPKLLRGKTVAGGADPMAYSLGHSYPNVNKMIEDISSSLPIKQAADKAAQQRMIAKYGDILNDGTIENEAREAIHNDAQAKALLIELKTLNPTRADKINREYLKAESKLLISSMTFKEIQPGKYDRAELKAAQNAATATDKVQQYNYKAQQLANHYMYKEAVETKERMTKQRKYVNRRTIKPYAKNIVSTRYAQNIMMLAKSYVMNDSTDIPAVVNWMSTQLNDQNQLVDFDIYDSALVKMLDDLNNDIDVDYTLTKFDEMTSSELTGLYEQLRHMRFVGGSMANLQKAELLKNRDEASKSIDKNAKGETKPTHDISKHQSKINTLTEFFYSQRRVGGILETLDGFDTGGPMMKVYSLINEASNKKLRLSDKMTTLMDNAFGDVLSVINRSKESTITKEDGNEFTLNHRARFTLALNFGNKGNRDAVILGLSNKFSQQFTESDILAMLSTMTQKELNAVNKVWAAKETLWDDLSGVEVRLKGVAPEKVQSIPFTVNGVKMTGGHYTLHYRKDPNDTSRTNFEDHYVADGKINLGTASSAKARVGSGGRQVDLDLSHLFTDLEENIHYITHAELAGHLNSMFKGINNPIVSSIIDGYGQSYYDNFIDTLSVVTQSPDPVKGMWKWLRYIRMNLTYGYLVGSVRNVVQQPIAITNAFGQLGLTRTLKGAFMFYSDISGNYENIRSVSPFMKNRTKLVNREAREQLMKIDSLNPVIGYMKTIAFLPQTFMDSLVAYPVWLAAYDKSNGDIEYADDMVAKTIGSGLSKDLGAMFSKGEGESQITFMGTFFNLTWNLHVENAQLLKRGKISGMEYARRLGWTAVVPALLTMLLTSDIPDDDDEALTHALKEIGYYNLSSLMLVRDIGSSMQGFDPSIPGLAFSKGVVSVGTEARDLITGDTDLDMETTANIIRGLQPLMPLPVSGQIVRTMKGSLDPNQSKWGMLVEGKDRN